MSGIAIATEYAEMATVIGLVVITAFWLKRAFHSWGGRHD